LGSTIIASAYFPGTNTIIAVGKSGLILRSTDNGDSWSHVQSNISSGLFSVSIVNSSTAFVAGDNTTLLKTLDAGQTWVTVPTSGISGNISQIQFVTATVAFLRVGNTIYKSENSGVDWSSIITYTDAGGSSVSTFCAITETKLFYGTTIGTVYSAEYSAGWGTVYFYTFAPSTWIRQVKTIVSNGVNIAVFSNNEQLIVSSNSGANWTPVLRATTDLNYAGAIFINGDSLVAFTTDERIVSSDDGGLSWGSASTSGIGSLTTASSSLSGNGIILGGNGIQYTTTDFGVSWANKCSTITSNQFNAVYAIDYNNIWVAGAKGVLYRTTNGGTDWASVAPGNTSDITDIKLGPANNLYFTTTSGRIYKSTNSGSSWDSIAPSTRSLQEISFGSTDNGVACGINNGTTLTVFYTSNAGASWTLATGMTASTPFNSVYFIPNTTKVYACGSNGRITKSVNSGVNWSDKAISPSVTNQLYSVCFIDTSIGWVVGTLGYIAKTTNGGTSWSQKASGLTTYNLQSVRFSDSQNGIIVGNGGTILKTTDGGATWVKSAQITENSLMSASLIDGSITLVAGYNGTILKSFNAPLPVQLTTFSGSEVNGYANLNWETATEVDNYGFEVERKGKNDETWQTIGFVEGHFTSNSPKYYKYTDTKKLSGTTSYRLKQIDNDGGYEYSSIIFIEPNSLLPKGIEIFNYPNPFNPVTNINIRVPETADTKVNIYNFTGELVTTLFTGKMEAGITHSLKFEAAKLSSGVYFVRVVSGKHSKTHKVLFMK
jgi:photosystem II stability/assembly factor-like uncharacterized protein